MNKRSTGEKKRVPEDLARTIVDSLIAAFQTIECEQGHLLIDQGYTVADRLALSTEIAASLYHTGMPSLPRKSLHSALSEGEVQALVWMLLCRATHAQVEAYACTCLLQRPDFLSYAQKRGYSARVATLTPTEHPTPTTAQEGDPLPEVPPTERSTLLTRRAAGRPRRGDLPARRSGWHHDGAVPEP